MAVSKQFLRQGLGFSLVEVLVTMSIMLVLAATSYMYYGAVLPEQRIGRAKTDIQQFKKAVGYLKSSYKAGPLSSDVFKYEDDGPPWPASPVPYRPDEENADPTLDKLLKYQIVPALTQDPWGQDYRIDVQKGWIYSYGEDGLPHAGDELGDDVIDSYQPEFLPVRARLAAGNRYLDVEFTREVSREVRDATNKVISRVSKGNFSVSGSTVQTAVVDFASPYVIRLRLAESTAPPNQVIVRQVDPGSGNILRSADGAVLATEQMALTTRPGGLFVAAASGS